MGWFESKRALLEYLGKNTDDRKLIKRMIERGEVYEEWGMFYLSEKAEKGVEKKEENKSEPKEMADKQTMDDKELKELKEKNEKLYASYKEVVRKYNHLLDEYEKTKKMADANLYWHLKIFYEKYMIWKDFVEKKVWYQAKQRWVDEDAIRDEVYWWYKYSEDEDMKSAIEFVWKYIEEREKEIKEEIASLPF